MSTETDVKTEEKNRKASQFGATTWKVTLKRVLNAFAKWRTRLLTNFIGFHTLFGRSPSANRRFEKLSETCQKFALRLSCKGCIWQELNEPIFFGQ